jgi:multidrug efflux pump subunit AcrB
VGDAGDFWPLLSRRAVVLVDDVTVEIENVHSNMRMRRKTLVRAILDGAQGIAVPAIVSTLCICIVFVLVLMLSGAAKYRVHTPWL